MPIADKIRYIFILHSPRFWEVRPPTKQGMKRLLDYIRMVNRRKRNADSRQEKRMAKFRKKPVVIEATQWFKNGDHPDDWPTFNEREKAWEGKVVRYFRRPDVSGETACRHCSLNMHVHGWIDTKEGGHIVCPGDYVITGVQGERYPCKPDIFAATYESVEVSDAHTR